MAMAIRTAMARLRVPAGSLGGLWTKGEGCTRRSSGCADGSDPEEVARAARESMEQAEREAKENLRREVRRGGEDGA